MHHFLQASLATSLSNLNVQPSIIIINIIILCLFFFVCDIFPLKTFVEFSFSLLVFIINLFVLAPF